ncbi:MAG: DUF2267 domain-containing protein [Hymenobacteraceae bacterium]|nr:DUF2267 domain-containing protein [Hymenobacteraceae bacterium]
MPFNFEDNVKNATVLLQEVAGELNTDDMNKAGRIFRAVLHAMRDRLPLPDAVQFASQLPVFWKGIYFDQYDPGKAPVSIHNANEWINYIRSKNAFAANNDFQQDEEIIVAFKSVIQTLERHMTDGQLQRAKESLNRDIQELLTV